MYRALTVAREYESGGDRIAALVAARLGWTLLDGALIEEIARRAHVDPSLAREYDEQVDSWVHRISRNALWNGAFEGVAVLEDTTVFDAETMASLARTVIGQAADDGSCVIVGRGSQCILQERLDTFHVFFYAPWNDRVLRACSHGISSAEVEDELHASDERRARFIKTHHLRDWRDPHLYDLLISTTLGEEAVVSTILSGMGLRA